MKFISNDDETPVNNVKEFELSASETFKDIREQLIGNIDLWKKSLVRYLNGVADKVNIGRAKITAKVKEWIDPKYIAYTEETFVDGDVLGEYNRFLYVNPKPNELKNVLSPVRSSLDVDRSLGKKDKSNRPRATFLENSSVVRASSLLDILTHLRELERLLSIILQKLLVLAVKEALRKLQFLRTLVCKRTIFS